MSKAFVNPISIPVQCVDCREKFYFVVEHKDLVEFQSPGRRHIQDIFPYLTDDEREMLISGFCKNCWDKIFPPEEEEK
jgi:hypothetical protein